MDFAACTAGANRAPPASAVPKAAEPFRKLRRFGRRPWTRLGMAFLPSSGPKRRPIGTRLAFPQRFDGSALTRSLRRSIIEHEFVIRSFLMRFQDVSTAAD